MLIPGINKLLPCFCLQAAVNGHSKVVELLLAAGADTSLPNKDGRTPAAMAKTPELQAQLAGSS
jgi:hypothetical protein